MARINNLTLCFLSIIFALNGILEFDVSNLTNSNEKTENDHKSESTDDINLLAEVIYWENYGNGEKAMEYTGSVVLNRVNHCNWCPDNIHDVIYQKGQYSTVSKFFTAKIPKECYDIAERLIRDGSVLPDNVIYQAMSKQGAGVFEKVGTDYFCYGFDSEID